MVSLHGDECGGGSRPINPIELSGINIITHGINISLVFAALCLEPECLQHGLCGLHSCPFFACGGCLCLLLR